MPTWKLTIFTVAVVTVFMTAIGAIYYLDIARL